MLQAETCRRRAARRGMPFLELLMPRGRDVLDSLESVGRPSRILVAEAARGTATTWNGNVDRDSHPWQYTPVTTPTKPPQGQTLLDHAQDLAGARDPRRDSIHLHFLIALCSTSILPFPARVRRCVCEARRDETAVRACAAPLERDERCPWKKCAHQIAGLHRSACGHPSVGPRA